MTVFCTYCSAEKDTADALLPAIRRYRSDRIARIYAAALAAGCGFVILSGEFGLLEPSAPIPYYDHLLLAEEANAQAFRVAAQLKEQGIAQVLFFTLPLAKDEKLAPYHAALRKACETATVKLNFVEIDFA
ncbi:MAG TPA: hypothetical protein PLD20_02215 [Blastocatellia bacterium]|nr:hypothetical protein [Blastocatellia bacterium]HMX30030.1 hypothetical protein [Blastocatellia bacterium]HMY74599.1 hypothetical protein [Blastocatellia bacterium]HMZ16752.1 hypothetical protein [Blastocatellia bacterium]HNG28254.1 hypothetical protein [Blastocatellia bacterium]